LVWCSSGQVVMASWARRPVVGALAAFIIVAILAPTVLLIHELLSLSAL